MKCQFHKLGGSQTFYFNIPIFLHSYIRDISQLCERPGGGDGVLDLNSGVFTCITPGYYTVSFSLYGVTGPSISNVDLYLYKNGLQLPESNWHFGKDSGALNAAVGLVGSRIVVNNLLEMLARKLPNVISPCFQILHLDEGDTLELRMTSGDYIRDITLNIELTGLGFNYLV